MFLNQVLIAWRMDGPFLNHLFQMCPFKIIMFEPQLKSQGLFILNPLRISFPFSFGDTWNGASFQLFRLIPDYIHFSQSHIM